MPAIGVDGQRSAASRSSRSAPASPGVAGALLAQTTQFVGIDSLGFQRSADLLIMLVLGGTGRLYGALIGAAVFMVAQDYLAGINPVYWQFWLGAGARGCWCCSRAADCWAALDALRRRRCRGRR